MLKSSPRSNLTQNRTTTTHSTIATKPTRKLTTSRPKKSRKPPTSISLAHNSQKAATSTPKPPLTPIPSPPPPKTPATPFLTTSRIPLSEKHYSFETTSSWQAPIFPTTREFDAIQANIDLYTPLPKWYRKPLTISTPMQVDAEANPEAAQLYQSMYDAFQKHPSQFRSLQFPAWCVDTFIPTKPFTTLLSEIAATPTDQFPLTKTLLHELLIPLWNTYNEKVQIVPKQFKPMIDNDYSPSAIHLAPGEILIYPQILHHHEPDIQEITRHFYNLKTGQIQNIPDLSQITEITDEHFEKLYESTVLLRYVHHQEGLLKFIRRKYEEIAEVALYEPEFTEEIRELRRYYLEHPDKKVILPPGSTDVDITDSKVPTDVRYKYYIGDNSLYRVGGHFGLLQEALDYPSILDRCDLPSNPILESLHYIAKQLDQASTMHETGLSTNAVRELIVQYARHVWDDLNIYINPTEINKEHLFQRRSTEQDRFYEVSLGARKNGGWKAREQTILKYALTDVANPDPSLSSPLPVLTQLKYAGKYLFYALPSTINRKVADEILTEHAHHSRGLSPYLQLLYANKTIAKDAFGLGLDTQSFNRPALITRVPKGTRFQAAINAISNPTISTKMRHIPLFSQEYRFLYEHDESFQHIIEHNFDEEVSHVATQLEAAYYGLQRQYERYLYHSLEDEAIFTRENPDKTYVKKSFTPEPETLQRYNDQAFYLQEIMHDMEVFAEAYLEIAGPPQVDFSQRAVQPRDVSTEELSAEVEDKLVKLTYSTRQTSIFLEKWLSELKKPQKDQFAIDDAWNDVAQVTLVFNDYYAPTPDRRRCMAAMFSHFEQHIIDTGMNARQLAETGDQNVSELRDDEEEESLKEFTHVKKPLFEMRPRGEKGQKRVISRFEFPNRADLFHFWHTLKPLYNAASRPGGLTQLEIQKVNEVREFHGLVRE